LFGRAIDPHCETECSFKDIDENLEKLSLLSLRERDSELPLDRLPEKVHDLFSEKTLKEA